jgi:GT2 family glycosyltransferase/glycosyltransferase involved in cell wall biosynthesis
MSEHKTASVSAILVNFRGADDTITAINHLKEQEWPAGHLEIVVVENASGDDSAERIRAAHPDINLVESSENLGFAGGCNLGVSKSSGEYLAFLNNDARPEAGWIEAAVKRFQRDPRTGAIASKVLDWDGKLVDYIGSAATWFGQGYKPLTAQPVPSNADLAKDVLFGTGSGMFVRRKTYEQLGGFDERYFMFFEDVDFGWRLNLAGWRFVYEPQSVVYHKHHASMSSFGAFKEQYLLERNALFTLYKNLGEEALAHALPATLALAVRRAVARGELDSTELDLRKHGGDQELSRPVAKSTMAGVYAIDQFVAQLPTLMEDRKRIQSTRVVPDSRIWPLFGQMDAPSYDSEYYLEGYDAIMDAFDVADGPVSTRVLVITGDPIGAKMAGPAIRAWAMANALAESNHVTLVSLTGVEEDLDAPFGVEHVRPGDERAMKKLERHADVIVFQGLAMALFDTLRKTNKIIVADIYDPMHLEQLEQARELGDAQWNRQVSDATGVLNEQLQRGDFFLAASERQRTFYLGQLAALGRVNPANYATDPHLSRFIDVVPFGLSSTPPEHEKDVLKGVLPGIEKDDKVLLWSGGLYNWFDPKTLIKAVATVAETHPEVKLFFQGTKHPHPGVPEMGIVRESRELARELGVENSNVFFNASWVDYDQRQNFLTEADAGVSTHYAHIETTFSFRTRILDYLWAGLPMVVTEGDHFAELVAAEGLGIVVPAEDENALAAAIATVLFDKEFAAEARANIARVRVDFEWENVLKPLVEFVASPRHAPDLVASGAVADYEIATRKTRRDPFSKNRRGLAHDAEVALYYLRNGGAQVVVNKVTTRIKRRFGR